MKKIPTVFERDWNGDRSRVTREVHNGCEWVVAGEGVATQKLDGTACMIRGGQLYKRHQVKPDRTAPENFEPVEFDDETGKTFGWIPVGDGPDDRWHREAYDFTDPREDGFYELIGPSIQGNPERAASNELVSLRTEHLQPLDAPRHFDGLRVFLEQNAIEGIVFHHPDGRMAKIKARDFGIFHHARAPQK